MFNVARSFIVAAIVAAGLVVTHHAPASAQLPVPCDFVTGGGSVISSPGAEANFGVHGGCKHGEFWGHLNYVDHAGYMGTRPYHVKSTEITGYIRISANERDICGIATTNADEPQPVRFHVRVTDNGEPGTLDAFGIRLSNTYPVVIQRPLDAGNIELHKDNPSTTAPDPAPDADTACAGVKAPVKGGIDAP